MDAATGLVGHFLFFRARAVLHAVAKSRLDLADLAHHLAKLFRLAGEGVVRPRQIAIQREVLLDHAGAHCDRGTCHVVAERMIGIARDDVERVAHRRHRAQVRKVRRRRIDRRALQQDDILVPGGPAGVDGALDLHPVGKTGRQDRRLARFRDDADEVQVGHVERGDLVGRHAQRRQFGDRLMVAG